MKNIKRKLNEPVLDDIIKLDKANRLSKISESERKILETEQRFEATYYSSKFEGNKLSKDEARKAILIE